MLGTQPRCSYYYNRPIERPTCFCNDLLILKLESFNQPLGSTGPCFSVCFTPSGCLFLREKDCHRRLPWISKQFVFLSLPYHHFVFSSYDCIQFQTGSSLMVSEAASYPRSHAQLCSHPYSKTTGLLWGQIMWHLRAPWPWSGNGQARTLIVFTVNYSFLMSTGHPALTTQCLVVVRPTYSYLWVPTLETRPTKVKPWASGTPTWITHGFRPPGSPDVIRRCHIRRVTFGRMLPRSHLLLSLQYKVALI